MIRHYNFVERAAHYAGLTVTQLRNELRDAQATLQAFRGTDAESYYLDDCGTVRLELARRQRATTKRFVKLAT